MAYDGWVEFNDTEIVNLSRTAQLAEVMGIDTVWVDPESVEWINDKVALGVDYTDMTTAPWYDPGYPASGEFAGIVSLGLPGLDDSTLTSSPVEYTGDGGHSGKPRNSTLSIVASFAIVASTERGADYGKRWLARVLRGNPGEGVFCQGGTLRYFQWGDTDSPVASRRDVRITRGISITRKRTTDCSSTWLTTFTLTASDPYEYGETKPQILVLDDSGPPTGSEIDEYGEQDIVQASCPVYDYSPIYDPEHPALVPSPTTPDFYPDGWTMTPGDIFSRYWVWLNPVEPSDLLVVPIITLRTVSDARMVRVSIWPSTSETDDQCEPLFTAICTYIPAGGEFVIDGVQKACYVWDGFSAGARRVDSLVFGTDAYPIYWTAFNDDGRMLVTLDLFDVSGENVSMELDFVPKSD